MKTCLSRSEYGGEIARRLVDVLGPVAGGSIAASQYPKNSTQARLECLHRGANVVDLPGDQAYDPGQIDAVVEAADLCGGGWLTTEAQLAREHSVSLAEYRQSMEG